MGRGDGTFPGAVELAVGTEPVSIASADLNGDHISDLVVANNTSNSVSVLLAQGSSTFAHTELATDLRPWGIALADFDGDGVIDLAVANTGVGTIWVFLGTGDGSFAPERTYAATCPGLVMQLAAGDVDGDGHPDLAFSCDNANSVGVLLNAGDGTFNSATVVYPLPNPKHIAIADVTGDGHPDLVVDLYATHEIAILAGAGDGTFASAQLYAAGRGPGRVAIGDVDGDGMPDIAISNYDGNTVTVLLARCR
jgi:hypothetical protein